MMRISGEDRCDGFRHVQEQLPGGGILRVTLNAFLSDVKAIRANVSRLSVSGASQLVDAPELQDLLSLAEVEAAVCLKRTESRGSHYREDYPAQDDENRVKSIIAKKVDDGPELRTVALDPGWTNRGDEKLKHWA